VFGDRGQEPAEDDWRTAALWAARLVESDDIAQAYSAHLLAIAWRRQPPG